MSNEQITITFDGILLEAATPATINSLVVNTMLDPMYATANDILQILFADGAGTQYVDAINGSIFKASIDIDNLINLYSISLNITEKQLFTIKRDYVICYTTWLMGNRLNLEATSARSKSKFLGDVKVSFSYDSNPTYLDNLIEDAKLCYEGIKGLLTSWNAATDLASIFVKGNGNPNNKGSSREWWHWYPLQDIPIGASKHKLGCTNHIGKIGSAASYYSGYNGEGYGYYRQRN